MESRDDSSQNPRNAKVRNMFLNKAVVTASGHIYGRWRKELVQPSSISGIASWKCRNTSPHGNAEMRKTPFGASFGYRELEVSKHFTTGMLKCRNAEMRKTPFGAGFGYRKLECRNTSPQECRNAGMSKCEKHLLVQVSDTGSWRCQGHSRQNP
jgi:hypothetical protein